jgi:hypothetical protein
VTEEVGKGSPDDLVVTTEDLPEATVVTTGGQALEIVVVSEDTLVGTDNDLPDELAGTDEGMLIGAQLVAVTVLTEAAEGTGGLRAEGTPVLIKYIGRPATDIPSWIGTPVMLLGTKEAQGVTGEGVTGEGVTGEGVTGEGVTREGVTGAGLAAIGCNVLITAEIPWLTW